MKRSWLLAKRSHKTLSFSMAVSLVGIFLAGLFSPGLATPVYAAAPTLSQPTVVPASTVKASSSAKVIGAFAVTEAGNVADTIDQFTIENNVGLTAVAADIASVAIYSDGGTLGIIDGGDAVACAESTTTTTTNFDAGGANINFTCAAPIAIGALATKNYLAVITTTVGATNGRTMAATVNAHLVTAAAWAAGNLSTTNSITVDSVAPTVSAATTGDDNNNGKIDKLTVDFSEAVIDGNYDAVALGGGYTVNVGASSGSGTATLVYALNEGGSFDTGATPALTFTGANAQDPAGNNLSIAGAPANAADGAPPVFVSAKATSNTNIQITMSEALDPVTFGVASDWTATGFTSSNAVRNGGDNTKIDLTVSALGSTAFTAADFAFTSAGGGLISDPSINLTADFSGKSITDGQPPAVIALLMRDQNGDGMVDRLALTFSENLADTPSGINGFVVSSASDHGACGAVTADPAASTTLNLDFSTATANTAVGDLTLNLTQNSGIKDAANNQTLNATWTSVSTPAITDGATPVFSIQYYSDSGLTTSMGDNPRLKAGTYYIKITSTEPLAATPIISIDAEGTANDVTDAATVAVAGNDYKYTRTIATDAAAVGTVIENISISGADAAANTATNANPTNEALKAAYTDTTVPVISSIAPFPSSFVSDTKVSYTLSEAVASGTVTWTRTGGSLDVNHTQNLTGAELNTGTHSNITLTNNPTLVNGSVYTISFNVTDPASNAAIEVSSASVTYSSTDILNATVIKATPTVGSTGNLTLDLTLPRAMDIGEMIKITFPASYTVSHTVATIASSAITPNVNSASFTVNHSGQVLILTVADHQLNTGTLSITLPGADAIPQYVDTADVTLVSLRTSGDVEIASDTTVALTDTTVAAANATLSLGANATVGATGVTQLTLTLPVDLVNTDTVAFDAPANLDVSAVAFSSETFLGAGTFGACTAAGGTVTCTANGAITAGTGNILMTGIKSKYAATGQTIFALAKRITPLANIASTPTGSVTNTVAADAAASLTLGANATVGTSGDTTLHLTLPLSLVATDTIAFVAPSHLDVSAVAFSSDTFSGGGGDFTCVASSQTVTCTANNLIDSGVGTLVMSGIKSKFATTGQTITGIVVKNTVASANIATDASGTVTPDTTAGAIGGPATVIPADLSAGAAGNVAVNFTVTNPVPADGKLIVVFPAGFTLNSGGTTSTSVAVSFGGTNYLVNPTPPTGSTVTFLGNGSGSGIPASQAVAFTLTHVKNPTLSGNTSTFTIRTKNSGDFNIDQKTDVPFVTITSGAMTSSVSLSNYESGATNVTATIDFTTVNTLPLDGIVKVVFPIGFDVTSVVPGSGACGTLTGSITTGVDSGNRIVYLNRTGPSNMNASPGGQVCTITHVTNPVASGTSGTFAVSTLASPTVVIDSSSALGVEITPHALTLTNVQPASLVAGAVGNVVVSFTPNSAVPNNGKIVVTFPANFVLNSGGATAVTAGGAYNGTAYTVTSAAGLVVTLTGDGAGTGIAGAPTADAVSFTLSNIKNPALSGTTGNYDITTKTAGDVAIDSDPAVTDDILTPGALTFTNVEPATLDKAATGLATVTFTTSNPIPANGKIEIIFGSGFDLSGVGVAAATCSSMDGAFTTAVSTQLNAVYISRIGPGNTEQAAAAEICTISGVKNPVTPGPTGTYTIRTTNSADGAIDQNTAVTTDIISGLRNASVTLSNNIVNQVSNLIVSLKIANPLPGLGKIEVTVPAQVNVSSVHGVNIPTVTTTPTMTFGGLTVDALGGQVLTFVRDGALAVPSDTVISFTATGGLNGSTALTTAPLTIRTLTSGGDEIDKETAVPGITLILQPAPAPIVPVSSGGGGGGGGGSSGPSAPPADSNTATSSSASTLSSTVDTAATYSRPLQIPSNLVTTNALDQTKVATLTTDTGSITLQPNKLSTISVEIPASTTVKSTLEWDGKISPPVLQLITKISASGDKIEGSKDTLNRDNVAALLKIGSDKARLDFSNKVTLHIPVEGLAEGAKVAIYSSDTGHQWVYEGMGTVKDGKVIFETDHFTYFALSKKTGGQTPIERVAGQAVQFVDIAGHWAEAFINDIASRGIVSGKGEGRFAPDDWITRAELIKVAVKAFGVEVPEAVTEKPFEDVATDAWYAPFVATAKEAGIVQGSGGMFRPNDPVTRAEALKILVEAGLFAGVDENYEINYASKEGWTYVGFKDVPMASWFAKYVAFTKDNGIVGGKADGDFHPEDSMTRAEVAKVVLKALELKTK